MNQEIITKEVERTPDDRMVVHLYQEGSFYRAYEWSAWLAHRFIKEFKVTHRHFKSIVRVRGQVPMTPKARYCVQT